MCGMLYARNRKCIGAEHFEAVLRLSTALLRPCRALSDVDRDGIGSLPVDCNRQSYFPTPPEAVRDLNVDLIQPGKLALCTGEDNRSRCSADRGANVGKTAVLPQAGPEQREEDRIARTTEVDGSCGAA